jgi:hypothetical protein
MHNSCGTQQMQLILNAQRLRSPRLRRLSSPASLRPHQPPLPLLHPRRLTRLAAPLLTDVSLDSYARPRQRTTTRPLFKRKSGDLIAASAPTGPTAFSEPALEMPSPPNSCNKPKFHLKPLTSSLGDLIVARTTIAGVVSATRIAPALRPKRKCASWGDYGEKQREA